MTEVQSPPDPPNVSPLSTGDIRWLPYFMARGFAELVRARIIFERLEARELPARNRLASASAACSEATDALLATRIGYILPRISTRLPWRSDCLIQAIAAQNWLSSHNLASEIRIGVERPEGGPFGAHAWLVHAGKVVTGGDIARYDVLLTEEPVASSKVR